MSQKVFAEVIGHSFVRRLREFCVVNNIPNLGLLQSMHQVTFSHRTANGALSYIKDVDRFADNYGQGSVADLVVLVSGSNDLQEEELSPEYLAGELSRTAHKFLKAGASHVVILQAMPRTGYGRYGAAQAFYEYPTWEDMCMEEGISQEKAGRFNRTLEEICASESRVHTVRSRGLIAGWQAHIDDGVHLTNRLDGEEKFLVLVRGIVIHYSNIIRNAYGDMNLN